MVQSYFQTELTILTATIFTMVYTAAHTSKENNNDKSFAQLERLGDLTIEFLLQITMQQ